MGVGLQAARGRGCSPQAPACPERAGIHQPRCLLCFLACLGRAVCHECQPTPKPRSCHPQPHGSPWQGRQNPSISASSSDSERCGSSSSPHPTHHVPLAARGPRVGRTLVKAELAQPGPQRRTSPAVPMRLLARFWLLWHRCLGIGAARCLVLGGQRRQQDAFPPTEATSSASGQGEPWCLRPAPPVGAGQSTGTFCTRSHGV